MSANGIGFFKNFKETLKLALVMAVQFGEYTKKPLNCTIYTGELNLM